MLNVHTRFLARVILGLAALASFAAVTPAQTTLTAGDIAIIGWVDNGSPDTLTFCTLAPITAGTNIWFTDNGWTGTIYRGYTASNLKGNEGLVRFTATSNIPVGTCISSYTTTWGTWTNSGLIGALTGTGNSYAVFDLAAAGDQLYAFQSSNTADPLGSVTQNVWCWDSTGTFEPATTSNTGDVPPGLTAGVDAMTFPLPTSHYGAFVPPAGLQATGGDKNAWIMAIQNQANWVLGASGAQPSGQLNVMYQSPVITADPQPTSVCLGAQTSLSVTVDGGGITYQWNLNGNPISGATSQTYTIAAASIADAGFYSCDVANTLGTATSGFALLTIDTAPTITVDPQPVTTMSTLPASFTVVATGVGTLTYQWRKDGNVLNGETNAALNIAAVTFADAGTYDCMVSNGCGTTTSQGALLTVNPLINAGPGQPFDLSAGALDINNSLNANGNAIGNNVDPNGPYFAQASAASGIHLSFWGEANQPIVLLFGTLNPAAADYSGFGIGKIDIGTPNPAPPFIPTGIQTVVDGTQFDVLAQFFHTGPFGFVDFTFPAFLPPGLFGTFQAVIYNSVTVVRATNAVELTIF